jgi:N-succinyldiaminopimelate aminotransferase
MRNTDLMNPNLSLLQPYPFEKLRALLNGTNPNPALAPIVLSIGEPKHATPTFICQALADNLQGLSSYPATLGKEELRRAIAGWLQQRFRLPLVDHQTQVIPTLGSREAIFALTQAVIDSSRPEPLAICPNPFYQIYEGAALLAGARPYFLNALKANGFRTDYESVPEAVWRHVQLVYTCSPGNPTGNVMTLEEWERLFDLSERHGFVIAADECYSEIYIDNAKPPLGALEAAHQLGRLDFARLVSLGSLSKRSNVPGMRSGYAAGDAALIRQFFLYRTYHGSAMSPAIQAASQAAWTDEGHVLENRRMYREKFAAFHAILSPALPLDLPDAAFYFWARTPIADEDFTLRLFRDYNVTVLPGSYLAREAHGVNPGSNYVRIALVPTLAECNEAARRIRDFVHQL